MGNAVTCSLVDVAGTVTVTQTDGQILEFMQPVFASQVRKLHPGNWLVHYVSVHDSKSGKQQGKMSMLEGNEELQTEQIYFLLPIPSHFRRRVLAPHASRRNIGSSKPSSSSSCASSVATSPQSPQAGTQLSSLGTGMRTSTSTSSGSSANIIIASTSGASLPLYQAGDFKSPQQSVKLEWSKLKCLRLQEPTPIFSMSGSPVFQKHPTTAQPPRSSKKSKSSNRHKIQLLDWQPTLMTIQEAF